MRFYKVKQVPGRTKCDWSPRWTSASAPAWPTPPVGFRSSAVQRATSFGGRSFLLTKLPLLQRRRRGEIRSAGQGSGLLFLPVRHAGGDCGAAEARLELFEERID